MDKQNREKLAKKQFDMLIMDNKKRWIYYPPPFKSVRVLIPEFKSIMRVFTSLYQYWKENDYKRIIIGNQELYDDYVLQTGMHIPTYRSTINKLQPVFIYQEQKFMDKRPYKKVFMTDAGYLVLEWLKRIDEQE